MNYSVLIARKDGKKNISKELLGFNEKIKDEKIELFNIRFTEMENVVNLKYFNLYSISS